MTSKYMKRRSVSLGIRETQIKPKYDITTHLPEWLKYNANNNNKI